jgi:hypothetical protein
MIGKDSEASEASNTTAFLDGNTIPEWAKEYVNAAVSYGLISGYLEGTGYAFKPNRAVTRAEMVSLLGRGEKYLNIESATTHLGILQSISGGVMTLTSQSGSEQYRYTITNQTKLYNGTQKITSADLVPDTQLLVIGENGQAQYVEVVNFKEKVKRTKATLEKSFEEARTVVLRTEDGKLQTYTLASDAVLVTGTEKLKLSDFVKGDQIEFALNKEGKISELLRTRLSQEKSLEGSVYDVDKENKLLTIKTASGKLEAYQYDDNTFIDYKGKRFPNISDLAQGDSVKLELEKGVVHKILVQLVKENATESGTVKAISAQDKFITIQRDDKQVQAYRVADNANVIINGLPGYMLASVMVGDKVDIKVENGLVTSITAKNSTGQNSSDLIKGTVFAVDTTNRILSIKNSNGDLKAYEMASNMELVVDGKRNPSLSDLRKDMNVSLQLDQDNKAVYVKVDERVKAEVLRINDRDHLLTVKLASGETKVYVVDGSVDINIFDVSGEDLNDLRVNDRIAFKVSGNKVTDIDVERAYVYRVTEVSGDARRITGENEKGNSRNLYIEGGVTLSIPGVAYPRVSDVNKGDAVRVTYMGDDLQDVAVVPTAYGQVVSIDNEKNLLRIKDLNGVTTDYAFGTGSSIKIGDRLYTNISSLKQGDRVQIVGVGNGAQNIVVFDKVEATFTQLDSYGDRIYTSKGSYYLPDSLFNRQSNLDSVLKSLKKNDKVFIYMFKNEIYEIEKGL